MVPTAQSGDWTTAPTPASSARPSIRFLRSETRHRCALETPSFSPMELIMRRFARTAFMFGAATVLAFAGVSPAQAARANEVCMRCPRRRLGNQRRGVQPGRPGGLDGHRRPEQGDGGYAHQHRRARCFLRPGLASGTKGGCLRSAGDGGDIYVGTQYENRPMEALRVRIPDGYWVRGNAHVQNVGWQGWATGSYIQIGTVGQARHIEAVSLTLVPFNQNGQPRGLLFCDVRTGGRHRLFAARRSREGVPWVVSRTSSRTGRRTASPEERGPVPAPGAAALCRRGR